MTIWLHLPLLTFRHFIRNVGRGLFSNCMQMAINILVCAVGTRSCDIYFLEISAARNIRYIYLLALFPPRYKVPA